MYNFLDDWCVCFQRWVGASSMKRPRITASMGPNAELAALAQVTFSGAGLEDVRGPENIQH